MIWDVVIGLGIVEIALVGYIVSRRIPRRDRLRDDRDPESPESLGEANRKILNGDSWELMGL